MTVLKNKEGTDIFVDCYCCCDEGIRFRINKDSFGCYCFITYTNGHFYREQCDGVLNTLHKKLKKIWAIIRNKDYYYSEVIMNRHEFNEFKECINSI